MNPRAAATLLVILLAACGDGEAPPPGSGGEGIDLRPRWQPGETLRVREERRHWKGEGPFPAAADVEARAQSEERVVSAYRVTVLLAEGTRLLAARREYRTSVLTDEGEPRPTALMGRTYEIEDPFGAFGVHAVGEDGSRTEPGEEESEEIRRSGFRMAASLLPGEPVRLRTAWQPGRDLSALAIRGGADLRMVARLDRVEEAEGGRIAVVVAETDARMRSGPSSDVVGADLTVRETLRIDLDAARISSYRSVTEWRYPSRGRRPEAWRKTVTELTVEEER